MDHRRDTNHQGQLSRLRYRSSLGADKQSGRRVGLGLDLCLGLGMKKGFRSIFGSHANSDPCFTSGGDAYMLCNLFAVFGYEN